MRYYVDRIIDQVVILIEEKNNKIIKENIKNLPQNIHEGTILLKEKYYIIDNDYEEKRRIDIQNRFNNLKNK
ncbi:MAG: DUF3006 family protein [Candidatus Coprovivens sp.]